MTAWPAGAFAGSPADNNLQRQSPDVQHVGALIIVARPERFKLPALCSRATHAQTLYCYLFGRNYHFPSHSGIWLSSYLAAEMWQVLLTY